MIIHCDCCARIYDDAEQWTICPHNPLGCGPNPEDFCWWCDLRKPCVCDRPPKFPALRRCCSCKRRLKEGEGLMRGAKVADLNEPAKCSDCDYQDYLGSPGA